MIHFEPIEKQLFDTPGGMEYLGIKKRSTWDNLIRTGRITAIKSISRENRFARSDLDAMVQRELAKARRLQGSNNGEGS